ncbi:MAG: beta-lactamase family protein [Oscillospiraceae bacterium]|nr:beta-lactamase family protein [Oscillospiraceae bacterium]
MEAFEQVDRLIRQGLDQGAYPAAAIAIGIGKDVYLKRTYGDCKDSTLFDMASVSKIISATMIAFRFMEEGLIRLYDSVGDFYFDAPSDKKSITILQLLTHTGGFPAHFLLSEFGSNPSDVANTILNHPLAQAPGGDPIYSCMGYILLGKILEKIGGASLDSLAQEYVFTPLGMNRTTYRPTGDIAPTEMDPETGKLLQGVVHDENARFLGGISANAGVFSDIGDMTIFAKMLACGGKLNDGSSYLSPAMLHSALINRTPDSQGEFRGLGFNLAHSPKNFLGDLMGPRSYGHTGFSGTSIAVDPDTGLWIVLLTNRVCPTRKNTALVRMRSLIHNAAAAEASRLLSETK